MIDNIFLPLIQRRELRLKVIESNTGHNKEPNDFTLKLPFANETFTRMAKKKVKEENGYLLSEQNATYTNVEYFRKCNDLDLLMLKSKLDSYALLLFIKLFIKILPLNCHIISP